MVTEEQPKSTRTRRPAPGDNEKAVDVLLGSLELDEAGEARAAIARTLARKLDQVVRTAAGPDSMAVAGIAKGLREVLDEIVDAGGEDDGFVADIFSGAPVGDS